MLTRVDRARFLWVLVWIPLVGSTAVGEVVEFSVVDLSVSEGTIGPDPVHWSKFLGTSFDTGNFGFGGITGKSNATITPAVKAFGKTIIPAVKADTRTGFRMDGRLTGKVGLELNAGMEFPALSADSVLKVGPTMGLPDRIQAGRFFRPVGSSQLQTGSTIDVSLPSFSASAKPILDLNLDSRAEYGLFPFVDYTVGPFGFDFSFPDINLFEFDLDLNLPDLPTIALPAFDLPLVDLPNEPSDSLVEIKIPPNNPALSLGQFQVVNPAKNFATATRLSGSSAGFTVEGDLLRLTADIDGIATAAVTGTSFTGLEYKLRSGKTTLARVGYDLIDVQYGPSLGFVYEADVTPMLLVDLNFGGEQVLVETPEGPQRVTSLSSVRWDDLPGIALLDDEPVEMTVDFVGAEAYFDHKGALTLADYLSLELLSARAGLWRLPSLEIGPLARKSFSPLASAFGPLTFDLFDTRVDLGEIPGSGDLLSGLSRTITLTPTAPPPAVVFEGAALNGGKVDVSELATWRVLSDGSVPSNLLSHTLIVGDGPAGTPIAELTPVHATDSGTIFNQGRRIQDTQETALTITRTITDSERRGQNPDTILAIGQLQLIEGSRLTQPSDVMRRYRTPNVTNDGLLEADGYIEFLSPSTGVLTFEGTGETRMTGASQIDAQFLTNRDGHTMAYVGEGSFETEYIERETVTTQVFFKLTGQKIGEETETSVDIEESFSADGHKMVSVETFDNAGRVLVDDASLSIEASQNVWNRPTGALTARNGAQVQVTVPGLFSTFGHSGHIEALTGSGVDVMPGGGTVSPSSFDPTDPGGGFESRGNASEIRFGASGRFVTFRGGHQFLAAESGRLSFPGFTEFWSFIDPSVITVEKTAEATFNGLLVRGDDVGLEIENFGTVVFASGDNNLRPFPVTQNSPRSGEDPPLDILEPEGLTNHGTVRVESGAKLRFDSIVTDFTGAGTSLVGGSWVLNGADRPFDNLSSDPDAADVALIDLKVTDLDPATIRVPLPEEIDLFELNTDFALNFADVSLRGAAAWPYLNTIRGNHGRFALKNGQSFHTAGDLDNTGEIALEGSVLDVAGVLTVRDGGSVHADAASGLNWRSRVEQIDEIDPETGDVIEQLERPRGLEVIGATLQVDAGTALAGISPAALQTTAEAVRLDSSTAWRVEERTVHDAQGDPIDTLTALLDLGGTPVTENRAHVTVAGEQAEFRGLEFLLENAGTLHLTARARQTFANSATVDGSGTAIGGLLNTGSFLLDGGASAVFTDQIVTSSGAEAMFVVAKGSYLSAEQLRLLGGTARLDGVIEVPAGVRIDPAVVLTGAGQYVAPVVNNGVVNPGNSAGRIELYASAADSLLVYDQTPGGKLELELFGLTDEEYDRLIVNGDAQLAGELELIFSDGFVPAGASEWLLVSVSDIEGLGGQRSGRFSNLSVTGLDEIDPALLDEFGKGVLSRVAVDVLLDEDLAFLGVFEGDLALLLDYAGGDVALRSILVPEPTTLALLGGGAWALALRRGRSPRRGRRAA